MAIKITRIIKDSLAFNFVGIITKIFMALSMIYAAEVLGSEEYGVYGIVLLWAQYTGLIKPGLVAQATREIPVLERQKKDSYSIQNISISGELIFALIPFIILICSSFLYDDIRIKFSLILLSIVSIVVKINDIWGSINIVRKKFTNVAKARLISGLVGPSIIFILTKDFGLYSLVVYTGFAAFFSLLYYSNFSSIDFKFKFDYQKIKLIFKDGIILQFLAISFWAFRLSDRTMISFFLSYEDLGLYTFAANLALFLKTFVGEFHTVLQPIAWGEINKEDKSTFSNLLKTTYFISIISFVFIPLSQLVFFFIVNFYSVEYISASPVFNILSFSTYSIAVGGIVGIILNSNTFKKYNLSLTYSLIGLLLNLILDYFLIVNGHGLISIALATLIVQFFISFVQFIHLKDYMFENYINLLKFYLIILFPFLLLVSLMFILEKNIVITSVFNGIVFSFIPITISLIILIKYKQYFFEK